jgi:predicted ATPase/tetratricopeptide (TPR) repeat protein
VAAQPSGTVTLVFTDVEGSTRLLAELGPERYREVLGRHHAVLREAFGRHDGYEVDNEGDSFFYAFASAGAAVEAVGEAMGALDDGNVRIRVGIHSGEPLLDPPKYTGLDVHLAARIMSAGHGGQVLLSRTTRELVNEGTTDLGDHRLKDFDEPVRLYQLGDRPFPPLKTISSTNLPIPVTSFVGREGELVQADELLASSRLLTVTGPGGSGKTRFAVELASRHADVFEHGVFWVPLAPLRDPALVMETLAQTIGARDGLAEHIADRNMLVVLDNFEHVVEAAGELGAVIAACPNVRALVTSRELLRVQGEAEYALPPLEPIEGVSLFCERARLEATTAIEELCARLDSLPLALELAAAATRLLTPEQLLERLGQRLDLLKGGRDAEARQQTLRATIAWSYDLLAAEEQALLTRLSVFVGGWTLDGAEAVCQADVESLLALLDKSLIRRGGERYWMLETIREFAAEQLGTDDAAPLAKRHLDWFVALAEQAGGAAASAERDLWFDRLEADHANLRAALAYAAETGEADDRLRLATALWQFWAQRGYVTEGKRELDAALATSSDPPVAARLGRCQLTLMTASYYVDIATEVEGLVAECARIGDRFNGVRALSIHGMLKLWRGAMTAGEAELERALELGGGDFPAEEAEAVGWLLVAALYGPLPADEGIVRCKEAYERAAGDRRTQGYALNERAALEAMRGDFDTARRLLAEGRAIGRELEMNVFWANTGQEAYFVEMLAGNPAGAAEDLRVACEILEEAGERGFLSTDAGYLAHALLALGDTEGAERYADLCATAAAPDDFLSQTLWRSARAKLLSAAGDHGRAIEHAEEALRVFVGDEDINTRADRLTDLAHVLVASGREGGEAKAALEEALVLYERKGNLVAARRTRAALTAS